MIPVLFKGNETNFNHNGIGLLKDTLSCEVTEVGNGSFDLELVYPITGPYFKDLKNGNIIQAKPNDTDQPHNFRINEIDKTLYDKEIVVYAVSITNDLGGNMVKSLYLADVTPQVILNEMKNTLHYPTPFNFVSNITTVGTVDWKLNNPLNLIVGEEGSLVDIFGGEVKRTNDTIFLYGRRGKDNVTTIRAGKNLDGFKMTESFQGKYTQILPYFKYDEEVPGEIAGDTEGETVRQEVTVFGSIVSSPYHGRYPVNAIKPIDFSQNELVRESKSLDALNSVASKYFSNLYSEIDKPSVSINVDMVQLVDSEQYELYERLEKVELTDTVSVYVPEYDVDILVKINELKYDSLRERTISIVASSSSSGRTSLMDEISGSYKQFTTKLVDDKIQSATAGIINQILTQKNGSNMYAGRATPPENSKPGDIWFKDTGGGDVELYEFDGVNWVRKMYKGFGDDVRQLVDDKIAESNALFTGALDEQAEAVQQAKALAELAKTTATNASLSASAANQDVQQAIADSANARTELLGLVDTLNTKTTDLQTSITQQAGQISLKAAKTDLNPITNDLESTKARVDITEQSITSLVTGAKILPDGRTSAFATKIESLEGAINQRVTTQELNSKGYQTSTDVTNTINNRTDLARKTDIPKYVGGVNLIKNSRIVPIYSNNRDLFPISIETLSEGSRDFLRVKRTNTTSYPSIFSIFSAITTFSENAKYYDKGVVSFKARASHPVTMSTMLYKVNTSNVYACGYQIDIDITTNWQTFSFEIPLGSDLSYIRANPLGTITDISSFVDSFYLDLCEWKLETGDIPTAWSPAPEDSEAALTDKLAGYVTNQTYTTYTTNRQQTDTQITEQINQTVSKVPTGPVNLIVNGFDPQTVAPWKPWGTERTLELTTHGFFYNGTKKLLRFKTSTSTTQGTFESNVYNLKRNTKYTIRVGVFANSNSKELRFCFGRGTSTNITDYSQAHPWFVGNPTKLEYKTITVDSGNFDYGKLTFDHNGAKTAGQWAEMYIAEISIIEGEYNNSWTPSFDELITEQKFNETKATVDSFSRAIGTRDESGFVPNIARLVMNQDSFVTEVTKYGEHNNNLVQDSVRFSTTRELNGSGPTVIADGNITWRKSGATTYTWAGIGIPVNVKHFIAGEKYTLSFDYYLYQSPDEDIGVEIKDHTNNRGYCYGTIATASTPILTYHHFQQTFTIATGTSSNTTDQNIYFYLAKNGDIGIRNVMLVRGEKIGPFSTSQVDVVSTRVEQTANSYSIKFLNNANDITTQLNLTSSGARIKSSLIHLDGNVTVSGTAWMDGAIIKNLSADKITTGTLDANQVNITNLSVDRVSGITAKYLQSVIGTAFIDWMKGKIIQGYNNNMIIDLLGGNITLNSGSNTIKRVKDTHTAFVHFNDVNGSYDGNVGSLYAAIGVTSSGDGVNSSSSGRFAGLRAFRAASGTGHTATIDQTEIYGDKVVFLDDFTLVRGFQVRPAYLDKRYDLNDDILNPIRFFARLLIHLNNTSWNWRDRNFLDALYNDWHAYGLYRYGGFTNNKFNIP